MSRPNANSSTGAAVGAGLGDTPLNPGGLVWADSWFIKTPVKKITFSDRRPGSTRQAQVSFLAAEFFHFFEGARKNESSKAGMV
jgi:hypothetical protein